MSIKITIRKYTLQSLNIVTFSLLAVSLIKAQGQVEETKMLMSLGEQNGFLITIPEVDEDFVEDIWDDYLKDRDYGKTKRNKRANEYYGDLKVPLINGNDPIGLYAQFEKGADITVAKVWVDVGGRFISSQQNMNEAKGVERFLQDFYVMVRKEYLFDVRKDQEKTIKKAEKQLEKLQKKNSALHKDIKDLQNKIAKKESEIEKNLHEQEDQKMQVLSERKTLQEIETKINNIVKEQ